jgi:predicted ribosome quality control (RQC) complex YloA/Tae2 family protein
MYFDTLTLAAVADELRATILNGRIQRVLLTSSLSIGIEVYAHRKRFQVLASAHPQMARVHLMRGKPSRGVEQVTPLLLLLRKYALGGRIVAIEQPPLERILLLSIAKEFKSRNHTNEESDELPDEPPDEPPPHPADEGEMVRSELVIEPMDRRSNIMLVDEGNVILDSIKRVTPRMSQRVILPNQPYEIPPPQDKRDPRSATAHGIRELQQTGQKDLARAMVAGYRGVSPQAAREIVYRALGGTQVELRDDLPWDALASHMREVFGMHAQPTLVYEDGQPVAYAPYALTHQPGAQPQESISSALETFYAAREQLTTHHQRRAAVQQQLEEARQRLSRQLEQMQAEQERVTNVDRLRWEGEMIFAFMHTLQPGQTTLEVEGETIALDADRSPVETAQARFREYQRAQSGRERLQERLQEASAQLEGLEQLSTLLEVADEREQIEQIVLEAEEQGYLPTGAQSEKQRSKQRRYGRRKPLHLVSSDGIDIYIGRSAAQNMEVTFRIGRPEDLWLHVRSIHGAHVIVRNGGDDVPEATLREAAGLAAYFSRARAEAAVDVDLSRRSSVRKVAGRTPGLVTYRAEQTLRVAPLPPWS